jgi:hypothetical protein
MIVAEWVSEQQNSPHECKRKFGIERAPNTDSDTGPLKPVPGLSGDHDLADAGPHTLLPREIEPA